MTKIKVITSEYSDSTKDPDTDDKWDRGSTFTSRVILNIAKDNKDYSFETSCLPENGKKYYLLYTMYSTGDSFGSNENSSIEYIELYDTQQKANEALTCILQSPINKEYSFTENSISIPMNNGEIYKLFVPWNGYFESIYEQGVKEVELT